MFLVKFISCFFIDFAAIVNWFFSMIYSNNLSLVCRKAIDFYVVILYITNLLTALCILIIFQLVHLGGIFHLQLLSLFPQYLYHLFFCLSLIVKYSSMLLTSGNDHWHAFLVFNVTGFCSLPFLLQQVIWWWVGFQLPEAWMYHLNELFT